MSIVKAQFGQNSLFTHPDPDHPDDRDWDWPAYTDEELGRAVRRAAASFIEEGQRYELLCVIGDFGEKGFTVLEAMGETVLGLGLDRDLQPCADYLARIEDGSSFE